MIKKYEKLLIPVISILLGLLVGILVLLLSGRSAMGLFRGLLQGATGISSGSNLNLRYPGEFLVTSMPLILTGLAIGFAYRCGMFNIGAEGQVVMGSLFSVCFSILCPLPAPVGPIVALFVGGIGGALWAVIPGVLKAYRNVNVVISCIMCNYIGMLLVILAIYIIVYGCLGEVSIPSNFIFCLLFTVFVLKLIVLIFLYHANKKIRSQVLITSFREAKADLYSTIIVFFVVLLLKFSDTYPILEYADLIGSIVIGLMVFHMAASILIENSMSLLGEVEVDSQIVDSILEFIRSFKGVNNAKVTLIKYGDYYKIQVIVEVDKSLSIRQIINLEQKLKKEIVRHRSFHVKFPMIYITTDLEKE